ncbi:type III secretion system translocon subunit VopD, partial [Vibrio parahaemolyticus]|nr:type III secretion system translocon subunit VopD [Vibrio parahaemolyticus]
MLDKVGGTGRGELYGLGDTIKTNKAEKAPETKLEAGAVKSQSESGVSGAARYQLETPKAPTVSNQAQVVANLMSALAPTVSSLMSTTMKALNGEEVIKSPSDAV